MSSENSNKPPSSVPPTPSTPLPSSAFVTPDKFKSIAQRQKQRVQELNIGLNTVPEMQNETNDEQSNQNQNESETEHSNVDDSSNQVNELDMKQQFDLYILQVQQENEQLKYSLSQTQKENAYLQYQQRIQYQQPVVQQMNLPVPINYSNIAGKPEYFNGDYKSNPETWLDQVYEYMLLANVPPQLYVTFAATYFRDQARIWWSSMSKEDRIQNQDFYIFKQTLLAKYRPVNQQRTARIQLKTLKQINSVSSYNNAFSNVIQLINDMSTADKIDNYMNGLKANIQEKLITEEFTSLSDAMNAAAKIDTLLYNRRTGSQNNYNNYGKPKYNNAQAAEVNNVQMWSMEPSQQNDYQESAPPMNETNASVSAVRLTKLTQEQREQYKKEGRCFKCRKIGHMFFNCPTNSNQASTGSSHPMKPSAPISNTKKY
jgi:Retrotransposon gag protein